MGVQKEFLNTMPPREFVDCVTDDLFGQGVFVFTPSGQPMRLPKVLPHLLLRLHCLCLILFSTSLLATALCTIWPRLRQSPMGQGSHACMAFDMR